MAKKLETLRNILLHAIGYHRGHRDGPRVADLQNLRRTYEGVAEVLAVRNDPFGFDFALEGVVYRITCRGGEGRCRRVSGGPVLARESDPRMPVTT